MCNKLLAIFSVSLSLFSTDASEQCLESNTKTSRAVFEPVEKTAKQAEESRAVFELVREPTKRIVLSRLLTASELNALCSANVLEGVYGAATFWIGQCARGREEVAKAFGNPKFQHIAISLFLNCPYYLSYGGSGDAWLIDLAAGIYCRRFCENPATKNALPTSEPLVGTLLVTGWCVADKFFIDHPYSNRAFSMVFGIPLTLLHESELSFLEGINFRCSISTEEMLEAETFIVNFLCARNKWILDRLPPDACQY